MALVEPAAPRAKIRDTADGLEIVVPAKKAWFLTLFIGLWLCGWFLGAVMAIVTLVSAEIGGIGPVVFLIVWLVGWTVAGLVVLYVFLWRVFGVEQILLSPSVLKIKRNLLGFGRLREYELSQISELRVAPSHSNLFDPRTALQLWGIGGGSVAFNHGAATIRFGAGLDEVEANTIVSRMRDCRGFGEGSS
ncbi:MAG: hypothetical protein WBD34_21665 [Burkholderiaceae bacterium]